MENKYVVALKDAVTGTLHGGAGTFRILIDEEGSGAKHSPVSSIQCLREQK